MLNKTKDSKGFTIIEVMIVLAIAGLIMIIVFLAIPALQRNSRNTERKSDAARIASAVSNFVSNNNGTVPSTAAHLTEIMNDVGTLSDHYRGLATQTGAMTQGRFTVRQQGAAATAAPTIAITGTAPTDALTVHTSAACGTSGAVVNGPSRRAMALTYTIEPGSGANYQILCQDI